MRGQDIVTYRLRLQQLGDSSFTAPRELLEYMGCMQAQDFAAAQWAIGCRVAGSSISKVAEAFERGDLLRTHVLRPTWHFVSPADIGWMLQLTAPKIKAFNKPLHNKLNISDSDLKRSRKILYKALTDHPQLTRAALVEVLKKSRINTDDIRMGFLLMDAELEGLICSGGRQGKQFTYALLERRAPDMRFISGEAAIAALARRYFNSRGPATVYDFAWWSGLGITKAKAGLEAIGAELQYAVVNGQAYWYPVNSVPAGSSARSVYLLPVYDEYAVAYKDRSDLLAAQYTQQAGNGIFKPVIVIDGQVAGTWKRYEQKQQLLVETQLFAPASAKTNKLLKAAVAEYGSFLQRDVMHIDDTASRIGAGAA